MANEIPETHKCSTCAEAWATEQEYLDHVCGETGHKPTTVEHLDKTSGGRFSKQAEKALERGTARKA